MRKAAGEVKRRKLEMESEDEHPIMEDEHSLDSHCREIERECKRKKYMVVAKSIAYSS